MTSPSTRQHAQPSIDPEVGYRPGPLGRLGLVAHDLQLARNAAELPAASQCFAGRVAIL